MGEPVNIRCRAGTREAMLTVEETATRRQVFQDKLAPQSNPPFLVENLPAGTYRASLQIKEEGKSISDVFLVSR